MRPGNIGALTLLVNWQEWHSANKDPTIPLIAAGQTGTA